MIDHLSCSRCESVFAANRLRNVCDCGSPLLARYDLQALKQSWRPEDVGDRSPGVWRYREVLPLESGERPLTLGEGGTPILPSSRIGPRLGLNDLWFKDETGNPTLSFKARGMSVAVHRARSLGATHLALPSAGNAGSATAAYCSAAGIKCTVSMPRTTPKPIVDECRAYGAHVELVPGSIADAGAWIRQRVEEEGWFDVSTLREPYRLEGKKTMGYELAETGDWTLPDVIVYPTGGGTGLIGMWKAFDELEALGWIGPERPRMVAVQAEGCAPIVAAHAAGEKVAAPIRNPQTLASGLCVPGALGDFLILAAIEKSRGTAVSVTDEELLEGARDLAVQEGILASPEAGATIAALVALVEAGALRSDDRIVCFITGHGIKYPAILT